MQGLGSLLATSAFLRRCWIKLLGGLGTGLTPAPRTLIPCGYATLGLKLVPWALFFLAGCLSSSARTSGPQVESLPAQVLVSGLYDAENLAFDSRGRLFVSAADGIYMIVPDDARPGCYLSRGIVPLKAIFAGMALGPDGCLYTVCYHDWKTKILRVDISRNGFPHSVYFEGRIKSPNGLRFDDDGTLYAADFAFYIPGKGAIWKIERNPEDPAHAGRATPLVKGLWGPNGIVFDRNRGRLYFTETLNGKVYCLEKNSSKDFPPEPALFINVGMPGPRFPILDDLALDEKGNLYVCHYNGNRILVISPEGKLLQKIAPAGVRHPTALAFGVTKKDATNLYVTQKGQMLLRENRSGDRVSRIDGVGNPYRLPFLGPVSSRSP